MLITHEPVSPQAALLKHAENAERNAEREIEHATNAMASHDFHQANVSALLKQAVAFREAAKALDAMQPDQTPA